MVFIFFFRVSTLSMMRAKIKFYNSTQSQVLTWDYQEKLMGLFYKIVNNEDANLAHSLHNEGLQIEGHRYKLYTFSWLQGEHSKSADKNGLYFGKHIYWLISSPKTDLLNTFIQGILRNPSVVLGGLNLRVDRVEILPEPTIDSTPVLIRTLSPIVVSTLEIDESTGKKRKIFLSPDDPRFSRVILDNLCRKARLLGVVLPDTELNLKLEPKRVTTKLVNIHGTRVKGYTGVFQFDGPIPLFQIGYQAGFGERNGQGFGMVKIERKRLRIRRREHRERQTTLKKLS